jgi:hypothetical protein
MTDEQAQEARAALPPSVRVVPLTIGVDTGFYAQPAQLADAPSEHRAAAERLLQEPYVILPGDELRLNADALDVVEATGLRLVRISQNGHKSGGDWLKAEIARRGLGERVFVFERVSYAFVRFLLQNAAAYAGFVDASWQPAGWTVACESLSSGLPLVIYDGYVARELFRLGVPQELCKIVARGDRAAFARELTQFAKRPHGPLPALGGFAAARLDIAQTGPAFAAALRLAVEDVS